MTRHRSHRSLIALASTLVLLAPSWGAGAPKHRRKPIPSPEELKKLPKDGGPDFNRLVFETSPYLLQHAGNPVDWYPWGPGAFEKAAEENKPLFVSIGYSSCHWCHVMEHESFENEDVAKLLNENFVAIKVDREERPDIDEIYMNATQLLTGRGGWPNSVFLKPDGKPFWAGTYFPKRVFMRILNQLSDAWKTRRADIDKAAQEISQKVKKMGGLHSASEKMRLADIQGAVLSLKQNFDHQEGGFGGAPKFPPSMTLSLFLRQYHRTGNSELLQMVELSLRKMARGGMYDQLGGGFHRYSTDGRWQVPHFEKMLYDNALLASIYLDAYQATRNPLYKRIPEEIFAWVFREMTDKSGCFYSALDADSGGEEGSFYLWTPAELRRLLGDKDATFFMEHYNVTDAGNFEGANILNLTLALRTFSGKLGLSQKQAEEKLKSLKAKLLPVRAKRVWPGLDDKTLTSWNALMIASLARGYQVLGKQKYLDAAEKAAGFILENMTRGDRLLATHRRGKSKLNAYLDDYAYLIQALLHLYESSFNTVYLDRALAFNDVLLKHFWDEKDGGFFFVSDDHEKLLARSKKPYDAAIPSGNSVQVMNLLRLAVLTDNTDFRAKAERTLELFQPMAGRSPRGFANMLCAADLYLSAPKEIALAGKLGTDDTRQLLATLHRHYLPNRVIAFVDPNSPGAAELGKRFPLLLGKTMLAGKATAYVCENYACKAPVNTSRAFAKALGF